MEYNIAHFVPKSKNAEPNNSSLVSLNDDSKKKILKYFLFGLIIGITTRYIPSNTINNKELLMIAVIASVSFAIIDMISPSINVSVN